MRLTKAASESDTQISVSHLRCGLDVGETFILGSQTLTVTNIEHGGYDRRRLLSATARSLSSDASTVDEALIQQDEAELSVSFTTDAGLPSWLRGVGEQLLGLGLGLGIPCLLGLVLAAVFRTQISERCLRQKGDVVGHRRRAAAGRLALRSSAGASTAVVVPPLALDLSLN